MLGVVIRRKSRLAFVQHSGCENLFGFKTVDLGRLGVHLTVVRTQEVCTLS